MAIVSFAACSSNLSESKAMEEQAIQNQESVNNSIEKENKRKILIAYFSLNDIIPEGADSVTHATPSIGNTESAAREIQRQIGGDLFAIKTVKSYPVSHREGTAIAEEEMRTDARPELTTHVKDMNEYDVIFIGYPIWWYGEPMAIRTFLEEYDFSGKTIIPFCTSMGASVDKSEEDIASIAKGAAIAKGITLRTGQQDFSEEIDAWLTDIKMKD